MNLFVHLLEIVRLLTPSLSHSLTSPSLTKKAASPNEAASR